MAAPNVGSTIYNQLTTSPLTGKYSAATAPRWAKPPVKGVLSSLGVTAKKPGDGIGAQSNTIPENQALVAPKVKPLASDVVRTDPLLSATAKTPNQMAAAAKGATTGPGSALPGTGAAGTAGATDATGTTGAVSPTPAGVIGALTQLPQTYDQQYKNLSQQIKDTTARFNEEIAKTGMMPGVASDFIVGRQNQLAALRDQTIAKLQSAQSDLYSKMQAAQGAYGTALGALTQTTAAPYGTPLYLPGQEKYTGSGMGAGGGVSLSGAPANDLQTLATQLVNNPGSMSYTQAYNQLSSAYGSTVANQLLPALDKMSGGSFNVANSDAQAAAQGKVTETAGTATSNAYNSVYNNAISQQSNYSTALNKINPLGTSILTEMTNTPGINPTDSTFLNTQIGNVASQFNSPAYAQFNAQIAALRSQLGQYIQLGQIPTAATAQASSIVNGTMTIGALAGALKGIDTDLRTSIDSAKQTADYAQSKLGTTGTSGTTSGTQTGSTSGTSSGSGGSSSGGWGSLRYGG